MIDSDFYKNYKGPNMTLSQIWKHGEPKLDITEYLKEFYGHDNNWNGKLYTYDDIFPNKETNILRHQNKGWRIDYIFVKNFKSATSCVLKHIGEEYCPHASDHAPVHGIICY